MGMQKIITNTRHLLMTGLILLFGSFTIVHAQDQKWIRVGETQCFFMDFGAEPQDTGPEGANYLTWPTQYGDEQDVVRMKGLWLGAKNFYDTVEGKVKSIKVIGAGPRQPDNQFNMIFPQSIKLIGRYYHPAVVVDNATGTSNILYDQLDELDPNLPCDRMVVSNFNTSIGVSVTRRIMGFMQPDHDDYFIHEFIFKNSGIINEAGDEYHQTLNDFYVYFSTRPAFAGVTASGWGSSNWGSDAS
jgi:hypothetical protein